MNIQLNIKQKQHDRHHFRYREQVTHIWRRVQAVCVDHHRGRIGLRRGHTVSEDTSPKNTPPPPPSTSNHKTWATSHRAANTTHTEPKLSAVQQIKDSGDIRDLLSSWYYRPTEDKTGSRWIWAEISEDSAVRTWWHFTLQKMQCWSMKPKSIKSSPEGWRLCSFTSSSSSSSFKLNLCLAHSLILFLSASIARSVSAREEPDGLLKVMWGKCGISPTVSISNLLTSSEPQLDGRHGTKLCTTTTATKHTSSQTNGARNL